MTLLDGEIVAGFQEEAQSLLQELVGLVESMEEASGIFPAQTLNDFAQRIDRIMGAAKTLHQMDESDLAFAVIGTLAGIGKLTGYQAAQLGHGALVPIFSAFWSDTLYLLSELTASVGKPESTQKILNENYGTLKRRLEWLQAKVKELGAGGGEGVAQGAIDEILRRMGGLTWGCISFRVKEEVVMGSWRMGRPRAVVQAVICGLMFSFPAFSDETGNSSDSVAREILDFRREAGVPQNTRAIEPFSQEWFRQLERLERDIRETFVSLVNQIELNECEWVTPSTPGVPPAMRRSVERENPIRRVGGSVTRGYAVCPSRRDPNLRVFVLANCQSDPGTDAVECVRDTRRLDVLRREGQGRPESPRERRRRGGVGSSPADAGTAQ